MSYVDVLIVHFSLFNLKPCTSLVPVELLTPFWTVNLEGLSALVWHTFSLQFTYNFKQNYTKPITKRMGVKNQFHVSWRSVSRHVIRCLRVEFYSCTLTPRIYWPCVFSKKSLGPDRSVMQSSTFPFFAHICVSFIAFCSFLCIICNAPWCALPNLMRLEATHRNPNYLLWHKTIWKGFKLFQNKPPKCTKEVKTNSETKGIAKASH